MQYDPKLSFSYLSHLIIWDKKGESLIEGFANWEECQKVSQSISV